MDGHFKDYARFFKNMRMRLSSFLVLFVRHDNK